MVVLFSKLLCITKELGLSSVVSQVGILLKVNQQESVDMSITTEFDLLNDTHFMHNFTGHTNFFHILQKTFNKLRGLKEKYPQFKRNSKINKLIDCLESFKKMELKTIVFFNMKFIILNAHRLLNKTLKNQNIAIALNTKSNKSLVDKLPHRAYLDTSENKRKKTPFS